MFRDPDRFLRPGETLLWSGRPDGSAPLPAAARLVRVIGWALLLPFAVVLSIGLANLDEMEGAVGLWLGLLGVNAFAVALLVLVIPAIARQGRSGTAYGVTRTHALIVRGIGRTEVLRYPVPRRQDIIRRQTAGGVESVRFGAYLDPSSGNGRPPTRRGIAFADLPPAEARAAEAALLRIRGAAGDGASPEIDRPKEATR